MEYLKTNIENNQNEMMIELKSILGEEQFNKIGLEPYESIIDFPTNYGILKVKVSYRKEFNDLFIESPDIAITGTKLRIDFSDLKMPISIVFIDDIDGLFQELFKDKKFLFNKLQELKKYNENRSCSRLRECIANCKTQNSLIESMRDVSKYLAATIIDLDVSKGLYVAQGEYKISDLNTPLYTYGLDTCSALCLIDKEQNCQYFAHVDACFKSENIINSLKGIDYKNAEVYIMPGLSHDMFALANLFMALQELGIDNRIHYLGYQGAYFPGMVVKEGIPYSLDLSKKSNDIISDIFDDDEILRL